MLREGVKISGETIDLTGLTDPACTHIEGIPHSDALLRFANAFMGDDKAALAEARDALAKEMGNDAMVDAVGVASNFQRMDRIADATGIPADAATAIMHEDLAATLGTNKYISAGNTKRSSWLKRLMLKLIVIPQIRKLIKEKSS
ncbi:MAG: hypothetical protein ACI9SC_002964 [Gammaproteobacteria bacterium]|jgi:hypothetical protein